VDSALSFFLLTWSVFNDDANCLDNLTLVLDVWLSIEYLLNDARKQKNWEDNLSQCHSLDHKTHTDWPGIKSEHFFSGHCSGT